MAKSDVARCRRAVEDRLGSVDKSGLGKALTRFGGGDPLAIKIGRMTVALRRSHAAAMTIEKS